VGPRSTLPTPVTSFVGREREVAEVTRQVLESRLVTLVGAPGVGKTRLAREVAAALAPEPQDGAWWVDLASLTDPALVLPTLASLLGLQEGPGRSLADALHEYARPRDVLIVLDNCEHVAAACSALMTGLLDAGPRVRVLATSRQPLAAGRAVAWTVEPLPVPAPDDDPARARGREAVRLFVERASAARPGFQADDAAVRVIAELCRGLDGIPLAIELAAARTKVLTLPQIAGRLSDRFRLLTGGETDEPRHRTLRALIDRSYDQLSAEAQALLCHLAVFAGGCTLDALERTTSSEGTGSAPEHDDPPPSSVLDVLTQLVDRSLVLADERGGEMRYRQLETIRQYSAVKLARSDQDAAVRRRHRDWCLALAEQAGARFHHADQAAWFDRLALELDNLRAALDWTVEQGESGVGIRLGAALGRFWTVRGHLREGRERLTRLLALDEAATPSPARADALLEAGIQSLVLGELAVALPLIESGLTTARAASYPFGIANALIEMAHLQQAAGATEQALALLDDALAVAHAAGDQIAAYMALAIRAVAHLGRGEPGLAARDCEAVLAVARPQGDPWFTASGLMTLALAEMVQGQLDRAVGHAREALALNWRTGDALTVTWNLEATAWIAGALGQDERAVRLLGAAEAARERVSFPLFPAEQAGHDQTLALAHARLDEQRLATCWADGHALSPADAVAYALADEPSAPIAPARERPSLPPAPAPEALTPRERQVAVLIARGRSNRAVAAELTISELTAESHVRNILRKLGSRWRSQVAAWAVEHRLVQAGADGAAPR
jgi:predicted ATPase/DNA-binding CsgD family transcriptional regulator